MAASVVVQEVSVVLTTQTGGAGARAGEAAGQGEGTEEAGESSQCQVVAVVEAGGASRRGTAEALR